MAGVFHIEHVYSRDRFHSNGSARGVNISYEWVRGHNGHPLNELADRLAVLARRNREMGVDEVTNARMIASIRQDAKNISGFLSAPLRPMAAA